MEYIILIIVVFIVWRILTNRESKETTDLPKPTAIHSAPNLESPTKYSSAPQPSRPSIMPLDSFWVPQGITITIAGYIIPGGMLYSGSGLTRIRGWGNEAALIDSTLPVNKNSLDREGKHMTYWPSYSDINPVSRNTYLQWLAEGRKDPNINIGYVFLYFYGLERRLLADLKQSDAARLEKDIIIAEVERLLSIYHGNSSFNNYARNFLEIARVSHSKDKVYLNSPPPVDRGYELPLTIKVALGQMAIDEHPLPADWASAWVEHDPFNQLRTPAHRCKDEFKKLFHIRYTEKFGEGYRLKQNKTKLKASYRPASPSFGGAVELCFDDIPDVTVLKEPINQLRSIANACVDELDAYSRYLGRNISTGGNTVEAVALLPKVLIDEHKDTELQNFTGWLSGHAISQTHVKKDFSDILNYFPSIRPETIGKREALALVQLLSKLEVGMEPDVRFGGPVPKPGQNIVLFKLPANSANTPSAQYSIATTVLNLAALIANADESVSPEEELHLEEHLESLLHLSSDERIRLRAHTQWLLSSPPNLSGMKKRIELLDQNHRESIGKFLVRIAQADGLIDPTEVKVLTKIYNMLGLDVKELYSHAHAAAVEPVTIQAADPSQKGYAVPAPPAKRASDGIELDMNTIEAKLAETAAVSTLLSNIFTEEDSVPAQITPAEPSANDLIAGLDSENSAFMRLLASKQTWSRDELEQLADERNLLLDGALDNINDASFEAFGEPFFENEDPIEINPSVAKEIICPQSDLETVTP